MIDTPEEIELVSKLLYLEYIFYLVDNKRNSRFIKTQKKEYIPSKLSQSNSFQNNNYEILYYND
jgi:hypothetical protein